MKSHSLLFSFTAWQECIPSLGANKTLNIAVMHMFINDTENGMKFYGYQMPLPGNQVVISKVHNLVLGIPSPDMLNVPSGNILRIFHSLLIS